MILFRRLVAGLIVFSIVGVGMPLPAQAGMLGTDEVTTGGGRERIASVLERADVQAKLIEQGVNPAEVKARVAAMTDNEAALLASQMDSLPAGGFLELIVLVFVVLLLTDILGFTKVFPFTKPIGKQ